MDTRDIDTVEKSSAAAKGAAKGQEKTEEIPNKLNSNKPSDVK